jgi:hypothetical protein
MKHFNEYSAFALILASIFIFTASKTTYSQQGFEINTGTTVDTAGTYDQDGYDKSGYDRSGFDRSGYDKDGYARDGYNNRKGEYMSQQDRDAKANNDKLKNNGTDATSTDKDKSTNTETQPKAIETKPDPPKDK